MRERLKLELVADLLAKVTQKLKKVVKHANEKYPERENVKRLVKNFNPKKINEILPTSKFTAYSENKGEKLAFCTTKTKKGSELIDENTLTFVALHELSHIATKSIGHTDEFWNNFKFIIEMAKEINVYKPIDYKKNPQPYCGMTINDNPYFDFIMYPYSHTFHKNICVLYIQIFLFVLFSYNYPLIAEKKYHTL